MKLPKMLNDGLGWDDWHGKLPTEASLDELKEWADYMIDILTCDRFTYITNDEDGWSDADFEELKNFKSEIDKHIENRDNPPCNIKWADKFFVGDTDDIITIADAYEWFAKNLADDEEFIETYEEYVKLGETNTPFDLALLQAVSSGDLTEFDGESRE